MTIYDVLKRNVAILGNLRIPAKEHELWSAVQTVMNNEMSCVEAIEAADQPKEEPEEEPVPEAVAAEEAPEEEA